MFPTAPAKIRVKLYMVSVRALLFINFTRYQPIKQDATILKPVSRYLPTSPPKDIPNAIPSFSIKCNLHQSPKRETSSPNVKFSFTHIFRIWSARRIAITKTNGFFSSFTFCVGLVLPQRSKLHGEQGEVFLWE